MTPTVRRRIALGVDGGFGTRNGGEGRRQVGSGFGTAPGCEVTVLNIGNTSPRNATVRTKRATVRSVEGESDAKGCVTPE
jgi:hypothetical protein